MPSLSKTRALINLTHCFQNFCFFTVECEIKSRIVNVKGPRGALTRDFRHIDMDLRKVGDNKVRVDRQPQATCFRLYRLLSLAKLVHWCHSRIHVQDAFCILSLSHQCNP